MDAPLRLRLELDRIKTEHLRRNIEDSREDLHERLDALRIEARKVRIPKFIIVALARSAEIFLDTKEPDKALPIIKQAQKSLGENDPQGWGVDLLAKKARALELLGEWAEASLVCGEGIEIIEQYRKKITPLGLQSAYLRFKIDLYTIGVRSAYKLGDFKLALKRAELAKCVTSRRMMHTNSQGTPEPDELRSKFRKVCESVDSDKLSANSRSQLAAKRRALWDIISIHRYREADNFDGDFNVSTLQRTIKPQQAVIYYFWLSKNELSIFGITTDTLMAEIVVLEEQERQLVEKIVNSILQYDDGVGRQLTPSKEHTALLFPPKFLMLLQTIKRLTVSPHRMLHLVPFHAFKIDDKFFIDRFAVSYVPNIHALLNSFVPTKRPSLFALAVPDTVVRLDNGKNLSKIGNAEEEVAEIASAYTTSGLRAESAVGPKASELLLRDMDKSGELGEFSHFHFVCHGLTVDSDSPLESKLFLYDSILDGLDIAGFKLNAELVVLSACCSGQRPFQTPVVSENSNQEELPGDEIFGLQAAFFAAGARELVSTLWPVESHTALKICRGFHEALLNDLAPDEALQHSILNFRRTARLSYRSVEHWGPYFLVSLSRAAE